MRRGLFFGLMLAATLALLAGPALAEEIILYDGRNFQGQSLSLNQSTPDFGNFDNEASSVRVISGTWVLYRNANYGETPDRPSLTLGPGEYPNLDDVGFPRNRASSVRLIGGNVPPPPPPLPVDCPPPYLAPAQDGRCVFTCGEGTVPDPASFECSCSPGLFPAGTDAQGRRICAPPAAGQPAAPPAALDLNWIRLGGLDIDDRAYQTFDRDVTLGANVSTSASLERAALEYRAAEGPLVNNDAAKLQILANAPWQTFRPRGAAGPLPVTFQLSAGPGDKYVYFQLRGQVFSSRTGGTQLVESLPHVDTILFTPQGDASGTVLHNVSAVEAYNVARARGFTFGSSGLGDTICSFEVTSAMILSARDRGQGRPLGVRPAPGGCDFDLFGGRPLAPGWTIEGPQVIPSNCADGTVLISTPDPPPAAQLALDVFNISLGVCSSHIWYIGTIPIRGPVGFGWQAAFQ